MIQIEVKKNQNKEKMINNNKVILMIAKVKPIVVKNMIHIMNNLNQKNQELKKF